LKTDAKESARRIKRFERVCRDAGVKVTHQRAEIFRYLAQSGRHPDAEAVFRGVRKRVPTISLDTVYRTLWLLTDLGLITTLGPPRERARFDANLRRHHHFVCRRCGLISDFYSPTLDELELPEAVDALGLVETTHVEAEGVCRSCASQPSRQIETKSTKHNDRRKS
jgi:Fur family peroxide stress response transcriptional regulator